MNYSLGKPLPLKLPFDGLQAAVARLRVRARVAGKLEFTTNAHDAHGQPELDSADFSQAIAAKRKIHIMILQDFRDRIRGTLLPQFSNDPTRGWGCEGFKEDWSKITEKDAADFMLAMDACLVEHLGRGLYRAPRSLASEQFFTSGRRNISPRPVTLWVEPIITVAALYRLFHEFGWPRHLLGTQSRKWEFDVTAYRTSDLNNEYVACEVKKTVSELNQLVELMRRFAADPDLCLAANKSKKEENAYRKLTGLRERHASIFWALGPNGYGKVYRMTYAEDDRVIFTPDSEDALRYPNS